MTGYSCFRQGRHTAALDVCRRVAEAVRIDPETGRETPSRNKWQSIYILGQIYHSQGKAAEAIREYRRVEDRFVDAKQSIAYFLRKTIELPEVVVFKPGEAAEVELKFRNVAACDLKVYRIDLMKFGLLKRSLGDIAQINLAGIRPHHAETIALGDGRDYRDRTRKLTLPLKEEGAYLVVCRGGNLYASGMAMVSPLAVEVEADDVSGRVRATVKDRATDKYLPDVHVKVIGSATGISFPAGPICAACSWPTTSGRRDRDRPGRPLALRLLSGEGDRSDLARVGSGRRRRLRQSRREGQSCRTRQSRRPDQPCRTGRISRSSRLGQLVA